MNFPRNIRIIDSDNYWGHNFPVGAVVRADGPHDGESGAISATGYGIIGHEINQVIRSEDFEELDAQSDNQKEEKPEATSRIKYLYSVQDADGMTLVNTRDREYAREVKAFMGGKKDGVIIMAYAPVKEIR